MCNLHTTQVEIGGDGTIDDPCSFRPPPCKDGNTYAIECDNPTPEAPCRCYVNGVKTKDVIGNCQPTGYEEGEGGWYACGFPQPER